MRYLQRNFVAFAHLMGANIVATLAMSPALMFLLDPTRPTPFADESVDPMQFVIGFGVANVILSSVAIAVGLLLEPSVRIGVPLHRPSLAIREGTSRPILRCSALSFGLAAMVLACGLAFRSQLPELPDNFAFPPIWQGILMMLGAAVREEILFRFFAMNLFVWIGMKVLRKQQPTTAMVWATNVLVALVFAALHLVPASQVLHLNPLSMGAAVAIATIAGLLFGWIYWRHGLLMAMYTHAISGLLVYLGGRGLIAFES